MFLAKFVTIVRDSKWSWKGRRKNIRFFCFTAPEVRIDQLRHQFRFLVIEESRVGFLWLQNARSFHRNLPSRGNAAEIGLCNCFFCSDLAEERTCLDYLCSQQNLVCCLKNSQGQSQNHRNQIVVFNFVVRPRRNRCWCLCCGRSPFPFQLPLPNPNFSLQFEEVLIVFFFKCSSFFWRRRPLGKPTSAPLAFLTSLRASVSDSSSSSPLPFSLLTLAALAFNSLFGFSWKLLFRTIFCPMPAPKELHSNLKRKS